MFDLFLVNFGTLGTVDLVNIKAKVNLKFTIFSRGW